MTPVELQGVIPTAAGVVILPRSSHRRPGALQGSGRVGACVGAIFGGLSPVEAGRFQIIVLAAIIAAGAVTAVLVAIWQGSVALRVGPPD